MSEPALADRHGEHGEHGELALLRHACDGLDDGVVVADRAGRVVFHNQAADALFAEHAGTTSIRSVVDQCLAETTAGAPVRRELEVDRPSGRLQVRTGTVHDGTAVLGYLAVIRDISAEHRVAAVRRDFAANVSHELRTPVGGLVTLADAVAGEDDTATVHRLAERIRAEAERLAHIIDDLLDLSRIEASGPIESAAAVPLDEVLAAALDRVGPAARAAGVHIRSKKVQHVTLSGRVEQLVSAVANLLDNAVKYSRPGGVVRVRARSVGSFAEIDVADEGIGIPAGETERIFERFYRVDPARSRKTGGTGLGLAIVRHVALNHGGEVLVQSTEGVGSTFTLRLPRYEPAP